MNFKLALKTLFYSILFLASCSKDNVDTTDTDTSNQSKNTNTIDKTDDDSNQNDTDTVIPSNSIPVTITTDLNRFLDLKPNDTLVIVNQKQITFFNSTLQTKQARWILNQKFTDAFSTVSGVDLTGQTELTGTSFEVFPSINPTLLFEKGNENYELELEITFNDGSIKNRKINIEVNENIIKTPYFVYTTASEKRNSFQVSNSNPLTIKKSETLNLKDETNLFHKFKSHKKDEIFWVIPKQAQILNTENLEDVSNNAPTSLLALLKNSSTVTDVDNVTILKAKPGIGVDLKIEESIKSFITLVYYRYPSDFYTKKSSQNQSIIVIDGLVPISTSIKNLNEIVLSFSENITNIPFSVNNSFTLSDSKQNYTINEVISDPTNQKNLILKLDNVTEVFSEGLKISYSVIASSDIESSNNIRIKNFENLQITDFSDGFFIENFKNFNTSDLTLMPEIENSNVMFTTDSNFNINFIDPSVETIVRGVFINTIKNFKPIEGKKIEVSFRYKINNNDINNPGRISEFVLRYHPLSEFSPLYRSNSTSLAWGGTAARVFTDDQWHSITIDLINASNLKNIEIEYMVLKSVD